MKKRFPSITGRMGRRARPASRCAAFSLVEMMGILALMSILTVWTVTSFSSLWSASLSASGNEMVDIIGLARQNSISKNTYTVIAIKSQGPGAYSTYCLLELVPQADGSPGTSWTAITPWHHLGKGVVFENGQATDTFVSNPPCLPQHLPTDFPFQGGQIDLTSTTICQCYLPDGTLSTQVTPPNRLVLRLIEGQIDPSRGASAYHGATVSGRQVSYYDLVFVGSTGLTKIERP